jgi:uncharacterized membrane protein
MLTASTAAVSAASRAGESAAALPSVNVVDQGEITADLADHSHLIRREITVQAGTRPLYSLLFDVREERDKNGRKLRRHATLGVKYDAGGQGWYPGDTFRVVVDGVDLNWQEGNWRQVRVLAQGDATLVEGVLEQQTASVRIRLALAPERDAMDVEALLSRPAAKEFVVKLVCYPAYFTVPGRRRGDRWAVTAARQVEEPREPGLTAKTAAWSTNGTHVELDLLVEDWLFYYDRFFNNTAEGNEQGLCGLVLRRADLGGAGLDVTGYQIGTVLKASPRSSALRFTLWQSAARHFGPALEAFPAAVAKARKRLSDRLLFVPASIRDFDERAEREALVRLRAALPAADSAGFDQAAGGLATALAAVKRVTDATPDQLAAAERDALAALEQYRLSLAQARRRTPHALRFLALLGRNFPQWKIEEAARAAAPPMTLDFSYFSTDYRGDRLSRFPATRREMIGYDGVIIIDAAVDALHGSARQILRQFVQTGGGLVVAGGFYAYGGGGFGQSDLAELLPVVVKGPFDVQWLPQPAAIRPGGVVPGLPAFSTGDSAVVMWLQDVAVKPAARTPLVAMVGGQQRPLLAVGRFGEGRVAALAGTVYGVAPAGKTPFWECPQWPAYLAQLMAWTCTGEDRGKRTPR